MPKKQTLDSQKTGVEAAYDTDAEMRRATPTKPKAKRGVPIQVWLTPEEHLFIKVEAAKRGEKFSTVGRALLLEHYGQRAEGQRRE